MRFEDEGYRWRQDEVAALPAAEARALLLGDARAELAHNEWEVAYQILRELVWRFPDAAEGWTLLSEAAAKLGKADEARTAGQRAQAAK